MRNATVLVLAALLCLTFARPAAAILQFNKAFTAKYAAENDNEEYVKLLKKARCLVCHQGKKRTNHNAYGRHLVKLLDKKEDKDNEEKILAALDKVAKMPVDPDKKDESPTYGDLIAKGELPGGKLEDLKKEPEKDAEETDETKPEE